MTWYHRLVFFNNQHDNDNRFERKEHIGCARVGRDLDYEPKERIIKSTSGNGLSVNTECYDKIKVKVTDNQWKIWYATEEMPEEHLEKHLNFLPIQVKSNYAMCFKINSEKLVPHLYSKRWKILKSPSKENPSHHIIYPKNATFQIPTDVECPFLVADSKYLYINYFINNQDWEFCGCFVSQHDCFIYSQNSTESDIHPAILNKHNNSMNENPSTFSSNGSFSQTQTRKHHEIIGWLLSLLDSTDGDQLDHHELIRELLHLEDLTFENLFQLPEKHLIYFHKLLKMNGYGDLCAKYMKTEEVSYHAQADNVDMENMREAFKSGLEPFEVFGEIITAKSSSILFIVNLKVLFIPPSEIEIEYNGEKLVFTRKV